MMTKLKYLFFILVGFVNILSITKANEICNETAVELNDELISCCQGKPTFASEHCVDNMMKNNSMSPECIVECMFKTEFEIYDGEDVNLEAVKKYVDNHFNEIDTKEMFVNAFAKCHEMGKETILALFDTPGLKNEHGCDKYPAYMDRCIWYHTLSHCPERMGRANAEKCAEKVKWIKECIFN